MAKKGLGNPYAAVAKSADGNAQTALVIGGVLIAGYVVYQGSNYVKGFLETLGLKDSAEDKEQAELIENASKYKQFDPNFWSSLKNKEVFYTEAAANTEASKIKASFGVLNDDEEKIYNVFRTARSKAHASRIAWSYSRLFSADLFETMKSKLDEDELATVIKITESKPNTVTK